MGDGDGRDEGDGARRRGASAALLQAALAAEGLALPWPRAWLCASSPWPPSPPGGTGRGFPIAEDRHKATELAAHAPQKQCPRGWRHMGMCTGAARIVGMLHGAVAMLTPSSVPAEWRPAVILAAIDCADEANQQVCASFGITGFPTLKVRRAWGEAPLPVPGFHPAFPCGPPLSCSMGLAARLHQNIPFGTLQAASPRGRAAARDGNLCWQQLAGHHPSSWAPARPLSCVNTLALGTSHCKQSPVQHLRGRQSSPGALQPAGCPPGKQGELPSP